MINARCTCGYTEADGDDETIEDHLLRVFTPDGDEGADGQVHLEGEAKLACLCGLRASTAGELDAHFLEMLTPADRLDRDGVEHTVIA